MELFGIRLRGENALAPGEPDAQGFDVRNYYKMYCSFWMQVVETAEKLIRNALFEHFPAKFRLWNPQNALTTPRT